MSDPADSEFVQERAAEEAARWVLRCDRGLSAVEQDEFSLWLARDPRHGEQLARHRRHWERLAPLAQWMPEHSARPNPDLLAPPRPRAPWAWVAGGLAAAACVALVWLGQGLRPLAPRPSPPVSTVVREPVATQQVLEDGTVVELNRGATLSVEFTTERRRVRLERGEAHFTVTKNPLRPFVVVAHGMEVWAVGTAFNVRLDTAAVEVLVTEGRVQVSEPAAGAPAAAAGEPVVRSPVVPLLEAGQRAVVSLDGAVAAPRIATLTAGEIERVLAWQHRMLDFTAAPLAEVVAEFNRRNAVQLVVMDPELAAVPISASFRSDNIDGFVRLLEVGFGTRAERRGEREVWLRKSR